MPELPEVEVVRRGLADHVAGRRIASVELRGTRVARRHVAGHEDLIGLLTGRVIGRARRRGKYLWLELADAADGPVEDALLLHLGMSGQLLVEVAAAPDEKHLHARFRFDDSGPELRFVDQRTFGGLAWSANGADGIPLTIAHIAPDPFEPAYDPNAVVRRIKAKDSEIKRVLLDQTVVSGIGNIYADEALWRARVDGEQPADELPTRRVARLLQEATEVMGEALAAGGTSFDALYVNVNGSSGYFSRTLAVYGREGLPCPRCGAPIRRRAFMNRSSYYCGTCQRRVRARNR